MNHAAVEAAAAGVGVTAFIFLCYLVREMAVELWQDWRENRWEDRWSQ